MPLNTLPRIVKTKDEKAEETTRDHYIAFKVNETGRGQQVAQLRFS